MATNEPATIPLRPARKRLSAPQLKVEWQRLKYLLNLRLQWWTLPHTPYQPVFVLASHRSGSNLLIDYLNRLPGVQSHSEILCRPFATGPAWFQKGRRAALRHIRLSLHALRAPNRGCKFMFDQLAFNGLSLDGLNGAFPDAKYIVLYRQSLAEQYVSKEAALATDQWTLYHERERKQVRVHVDPSALRTYIERLRKRYQHAIDRPWMPGRALLLSYEELTADPARRLREDICPLLGVPPAEPQSFLLKQNKQPLAERVENYREVAALLHSPLCQQYYAWPSRQPALRRAA
jgi:LPS sulfotransferase NodH